MNVNKKEQMRAETERLVAEALARKSVTVKEGDTRIETTCGKCGAKGRTMVAPGVRRTKFTCKECGHEQQTL